MAKIDPKVLAELGEALAKGIVRVWIGKNGDTYIKPGDTNGRRGKSLWFSGWGKTKK